METQQDPKLLGLINSDRFKSASDDEKRRVLSRFVASNYPEIKGEQFSEKVNSIFDVYVGQPASKKKLQTNLRWILSKLTLGLIKPVVSGS